MEKRARLRNATAVLESPRPPDQTLEPAKMHHRPAKQLLWCSKRKRSGDGVHQLITKINNK
jgi:hypothetical protein